MRTMRIAVLSAALAAANLYAQQPDARQIAQERKSAEQDLPRLVEALELKPGMTVADIGSGGGAMSVVLGHWIGPGRVFATDVTENALRLTRDYVKKEGLTNVTVREEPPRPPIFHRRAATQSSFATSITTSPKSTRSTRACSSRSNRAGASPSSTSSRVKGRRCPMACRRPAKGTASRRRWSSRK